MSVKKAKTGLRLTHGALVDIAEIEAYSIAEWGKRTAAKYFDDFEAALNRLQEKPDLLRAEADLHANLRFYRVNKHLFVCDVQDNAIVLLTVIHAGRDIPSRLAEIAPTLVAEVQLLHEQLRHGKER